MATEQHKPIDALAKYPTPFIEDKLTAIQFRKTVRLNQTKGPSLLRQLVEVYAEVIFA